jgi:cell division protein FtsW
MMRKRRNHIDLVTLLVVLALLVISLGVVYSASSSWALEKFGESGKVFGSHAVKVGIGFLAIFAVMQVDYHHYRRISKWLLLGLVVFLLVTLALGGETKGAVRWLRLGGLSLQPSEFARFALVLHLAALLAAKGEAVRDLKTGFIPLMVWTVAVGLLVLLQPNFSVGTVILATGFLVLYLGGVRLSHLGLTAAAALPLLGLYMVSADYRMRRIMLFLGGGSGTVNYQLQQGIIGFGNGGLFGLGPGNSRQRDLFLPESYGDFAFSILGEEYGLAGTTVVMALFLFLLLQGIRIARHAPDAFGRHLALGICVTITLYAVVNAGVTLGLLPTTGLPMPFLSYGGSSMLASCAAIGVLLNISSQTDLHPRIDAVPQRVEAPQPAVGKVYS